MPKIPTYLSERPASAIRLPEVPRVADIPVISNAGAAMVGKGLAGIGSNLVEIGADIAADVAYQRKKAADELRKAEVGIETDAAMSRLKTEFASNQVALLDKGLHPDDYLEAINTGTDKLREDLVSELRYPESKLKFTSDSGRFAAEQKSKAIHDSLIMKHGRIKLNWSKLNQQDANTAVFGLTPGDRTEAFARGLSRAEEGLARGIYSPDEAKAVTQHFLSNVEEGGALRDFENPHMREFVINSLFAGKYQHMDPVKQIALAHTLTIREDTRQNKIRIEEEAQRIQLGREAEKSVKDALWNKDYAGAREVLTANRRYLTAEAYAQLGDKIEKGPVFVTPPEITREMQPLVYNAENDPREVDKLLRKKMNEMSDDDFRRWGSHLENRITRLDALKTEEARRRSADADRATTKQIAEQNRQQTQLHYETGQAQHRLRQLTTIESSLSPAFSIQAQDTYNWALEEMDRTSPLSGGKERPMDFVERVRPTILGRLGMAGNERIRSLDNNSAVKNVAGTTGNTLESVGAAKEALKQRRGQFASDADFQQQILLLREKEGIIREMQRLNPPAPTAPARPASPRARTP